MLASDLNNREFMGAQNPDDLLHVEFYWHDPIDWNKTQETGRETRMGLRIPYVRIVQPGDKNSVVETAVREEHKGRWPQKWLAWQMREVEGAQTDIPGWKLKDWPVLNEGQLQELEYMRFSTVEQLSGASDAQVQRMGIGGIGLREQARAAVKERLRAEMREENKERDKELAELRERDAAREKELADIKAMLAAGAQQKSPAPEPLPPAIVPQEPKRGPGRPPKVREAA